MTKRKGPSKPYILKPKPQYPTIFLGYCRPRSPGVIHARFLDSMLELIARSSGKFGIRPTAIETGPLLSRARNSLLSAFLDTTDDFFLWVDSDIIFGIEDLEALLSLNFPIAGSVYYTLDQQGIPVCAHLDELKDQPGEYKSVDLSRLYDAESKPMDPFVISGLGMGFTLIKREVIEALAPIKRLWPFAETDIDHGYGEDLTFCLRAKEKGFLSYIVPQSKVGHIKEIEL